MKKPLWFKAKQYGWGWTPVTWQGWAILGMYLLMVWANFERLGMLTDHDMVVYFVVETIIMTFVLIVITYLTGEKPRWRWGR